MVHAWFLESSKYPSMQVQVGKSLLRRAAQDVQFNAFFMQVAQL